MRAIWSLLLLGGAVFLAGCQGTSSAGFSSDEDALPVSSGASHSLTTGPTYGSTSFQPFGPTDNSAGSDFDNLEIAPATLKDKLSILRVGSDRTDENLLTVFAGLKNKSGHSLQLEVQTIYKDKSDRALTNGSRSWVPITLKAHGQTQYRSVAISEDASDYLVRIRPAEDQH